MQYYAVHIEVKFYIGKIGNKHKNLVIRFEQSVS